MGTLDNDPWKEGTKAGVADLLSGWTGGPGYLHEKTNHPISEQVGIQSFYCQGLLSMYHHPLSKPIEKPQAWVCPGEGRQSVGNLCALPSGLGSANRDGT